MDRGKNKSARDKHCFHNDLIKIPFESSEFAARSFDRIPRNRMNGGAKVNNIVYSDIARPANWSKSLNISRSRSRSSVMRLIPQSECFAQSDSCGRRAASPSLHNERTQLRDIYSEVVPAVSICSRRDNSRAKSRWPIFYRARTNLRARAIVQSPPKDLQLTGAAKAAVWLPWNVSHVYPSRKFVLREIDKSSRGAYTCVCVRPRTCPRATMNHS